MSDRIAVMNRGVIEQVAAPGGRLRAARAPTFVAGFIGVSNLMPGEVESASGGEVELRLDAGPTVRTRGERRAAAASARHAVVRPEKLEVDAPRSRRPTAGPSVEGAVESSLYLGTATQMVVRLPDDGRMTVLVPNADEAAAPAPPGGRRAAYG